jgi:endoglycosylceramidase
MDLYTAPEVASSFQALYRNENGLLDKMFAFWAVVAERFKNNPNVIGYDILNEPWGVNYHDSSLLLSPSKFGRDTLYPIAKRGDQVVRKANDQKLVFFEPSQFPDTLPFFGGITNPMSFPETPGGSANLDK